MRVHPGEDVRDCEQVGLGILKQELLNNPFRASIAGQPFVNYRNFSHELDYRSPDGVLRIGEWYN